MTYDQTCEHRLNFILELRLYSLLCYLSSSVIENKIKIVK